MDAVFGRNVPDGHVIVPVGVNVKSGYEMMKMPEPPLPPLPCM
jgi:hypothetical protein